MSLLPLLFDEFSPRPRQSRWPSVLEPQELIAFPYRASEALDELRNQLVGQMEKDSSITCDKDKFQANIDVQQFKPEEISVKFVGDNVVTVEGKHEEKQDEHGFISRHFVRKYVLPDDCDVNQVKSKLSSDGVLSITAPKKPEGKQVKEIPVIRTGKPVKRIEKKESGEDDGKQKVSK